MRITSQDVRKKYPNPISVKTKTASTEWRDRDGEYCVLGALSQLLVSMKLRELFLFESRSFPSHYSGGYMLEMLNPRLSSTQATEAAYQIIKLNDAGKFDEAWSMIDETLAFKPQGAAACG